jgi:hypothetical protein
MHEPVISPFIIYLIGILDGLNALFIATFITTLICLVVCIIGKFLTTLDQKGWNTDVKILQTTLSKWLKTTTKIFIPLALLVALVPTKSTIIQMYVASMITPHNIEIAVDAGKSVKDEIVKDLRLLLNDTEEIVGKVTEEIKDGSRKVNKATGNEEKDN